MASIIDVSDLFRRVASVNCMGLNLTLHSANGQKGEPLGKITQLVLHWTAGDYRGVWDDYHYNVAFDRSEKRACIVKTLDLTQKGQHLWKRNTGAVGVSFCAMADHRFPVTEEQKEACALLLAELCYKLNLDPRLKGTITDHAEWAKVDGYYPDRWDIGSQAAGAANLLKPLEARTIAIWHELKAGKRKLTLESILK